MQKKVIAHFHYALNPGGILFMGPSETIGDNSRYFTPLSVKQKIFKRTDDSFPELINYPPLIVTDHLPAKKIHADGTGGEGFDVCGLAERLLLNEYAPPAVLIDRDFEIHHFMGPTDRFLKTPQGKASFNIERMAREGLQPRLLRAITQSFQTNAAVIQEQLMVNRHGSLRPVEITVQKISETRGGKHLRLVVFKEGHPENKPSKKRASGKTGKNDEIQTVENELLAVRKDLQATVEELEASNEEHRAVTEELQSVNEELQSSNEELETSREELQSTNEELLTVNSEHQQKIQELTKANNDINNLLASTEIASLFLTLDLCIRRFTPAVRHIINLRQSDIGRPLSDITTSLPGTPIVEYAREVLDTLERKRVEIHDTEGRWYEMRILPYRTTENMIDGVTISFIEITPARQVETLRRLSTLFEDSSDAITIQQFDGQILGWNKKAATLYGWTPEEALTKNIAEMTPPDRQGELKQFMDQLAAGTMEEPFQTQRLTRDGRCLDIWLIAWILADENGRPLKFAAIERPAGSPA